MAASLLALLSQQTPSLQTRKGLILTGLQNDFLSPEGKLPVSTASGFLDRLRELVPAFREFGDIIWVRSNFQESQDENCSDEAGDHVIAGTSAEEKRNRAEAEEGDRDDSPVPPKKARISLDEPNKPITVEDLIKRIETGHPGLKEIEDELPELFLSEAPMREPCCIPGTLGAEYATEIQDLIDAKQDMQFVKTYYSAFESTSLLTTLRSKLITELFICGCMTDLTVFATAMDAARYGIKVTLVEDCLGYRRKDRHDLAIKQLREIMEAHILPSIQVIDILRYPPLSPEYDYDDENEDGEDHEDGESDLLVGEDADGASLDLLAPDSDVIEGDYVSSTVRFSTLPGLPLEIRCVSSTTSLQGAIAAEPKPIPSTQLPEPSSSRGSGTSGIAIDSDDTSIEPIKCSRDGQRDDNFEHRVAAAPSGSSLARLYESSKEVILKQRSVDIVEQDWNDHQMNVSQRLGRSKHPGLAAISAVSGLDQATVDRYEEMMEAAQQSNDINESRKLESKPLFGHDKNEESAGSRIQYQLLPLDLSETIFAELNHEITWQKMHHQTGEVPRLVCCQGTIGEDGSMPVYRHPSDQTLPIQPWTAAVDKTRRAAEDVVGHPLNHALIQLYRGGTDYISEHSDKTLDIVKGSFIVNVSFGAQRTMRLRTKRQGESKDCSPTRTTYRVPMPHNSIIMMSLATNAEFLHGINADKRPSCELTEAETAFKGQRISLTFRNIGTFLNEDSTRIWGQGATSKSTDNASPVVNGHAVESQKLVRAFGAENQSSSIDWNAIYGSGFDVLHLE